MNKGTLLRYALWVGASVVLLILVCGSASVSLIVADWVFTETEVSVIAWFIGIAVMLFASITLGIGFGFFLSKMDEKKYKFRKPPHVTDALEDLLTSPTPTQQRD